MTVIPRRLIRLPVFAAAVTAVAGLALAGSASAGSGGASFVDYAQCSNNSPPTIDAGCPGGWINGILNATNTHYAEDQVSPQRVEVKVPAGSASTARTITLEYMTRKGAASIHAYDYLTTWNLTQSAADRCAGLVAADCVAPVAVALCPNQANASSPSVATIPLDPNPVYPVGTGVDPVTSAHEVAGTMLMYGGCIDSISVPVHSAAPTDASTDDTATQVITYHVNGTAGLTTADQKVQLLFGGHLATGAGVPRGWGAGLGASSANGGPYHIKLAQVDGASVGNRDNQIQAAAVLVPDLHVTKAADAPSVGAGSPIGFTATVTNQQNASSTTGAAENATMSDPLPTGAGVSWSVSPAYAGPGTCAVTGSPQVLSCSFGAMNAGASASVHVLSQTNTSSCGTYPATASAQATNAQMVSASASTDVLCSPVTAVNLVSFRAHRVGAGVSVTWRTGAETGVAGFRVWARSGGGRYARLPASLVVAKGRPAAYRFVDRSASMSRARLYRLETVLLDGSSRFAGPIRAS